MGGATSRGETLRVILITALVLAVLAGPPLVSVVQPDPPGDGSQPVATATSTVEPGSARASALQPDTQKAAEISNVTAAVAAADDVVNRLGANAMFGTAVLDRKTGQLALGRSAAEPMYTASLSKLVLAVDILDRRRSERLPVTDRDLNLLSRALGPSDDGAMNALWSRFDGVGAMSRVPARLELAATAPPRDPSQWGEAMISAADTVALWQYVLDDMAAEDADLFVSWMRAAPPRAADGFDQQFGLLDVRGSTGGGFAKQGWMCCHSRQFTLHSAGALGADLRYVVAVLSTQPRDIGWEMARARLTQITDVLARNL